MDACGEAEAGVAVAVGAGGRVGVAVGGFPLLGWLLLLAGAVVAVATGVLVGLAVGVRVGAVVGVRVAVGVDTVAFVASDALDDVGAFCALAISAGPTMGAARFRIIARTEMYAHRRPSLLFTMSGPSMPACCSVDR